MALKQDERALLQLVCERGQSYEDLAGLLGISEDEVRAKARRALGELGGADPDADVGLTDYLLGQADPIGRADAVRYLQQDDEARDLATAISIKLQAIAPGASLPTIPEPKGRKRRAATPSSSAAAPVADAGATTRPAAAAGAAGGSSRPVPQNRLIAAIAGGGIILLFVILAVAGVFSGDDSASTTATGTETTAEGPDAESSTGLSPEVVAGLSDEQKAELTGLAVEDVAQLSDEEIVAAAEQRTITPVKLDAVGGSGVAGAANFGLAGEQLFIDLDLEGLDPDIGGDDAYVIWMMLQDEGGYPVSIVEPNENGQVQDQYAVPTPVAVAIGSAATSVRVSLSSGKELDTKINQALEANEPIVPFTGETLAEGKIPLAAGGGGSGGGGGN